MIHFVHVPKTGGTTFITNLKKNKVKFEAGHNVWCEKKNFGKYITFLRHPLYRTLSQAKWEIEKSHIVDSDFLDWFVFRQHNFQVKFLRNRFFKIPESKEVTKTDVNNIKKFLKKNFLFVFLTEELDISLPKLLKFFDLKLYKEKANVSKRDIRVSESTIKHIIESNKLDFELYEWVRKIYKDGMLNNSNFRGSNL